MVDHWRAIDGDYEDEYWLITLIVKINILIVIKFNFTVIKTINIIKIIVIN